MDDFGSSLTTGQVARRFNLSLATLRHYEDVGLLAPCRIGGQRAYKRTDLKRLALVLERRRSGATLAEIKASLKAGCSGSRTGSASDES